jgi:ribosomal protein S18 acetylase RimI-like enzyme
MFPLSEPKQISYFKRFKMEIGLYDAPLEPALPDGYDWVPWSDNILHEHAEVLYSCFHEEIDSNVFPSLSDRDGCIRLMTEIRNRRGFLPGATWLIASPFGFCGTIQGLREQSGLGAIQNIGVTSSHRGLGLGSALVLQALHGFRRAGLGRAYLEVTAQNDSAIRLYRRLGFRRHKTVYKAVQNSTQ